LILIGAGDSLLIVVADGTTRDPAARNVNLLVLRLIQNGIHPAKSRSSLPPAFIEQCGPRKRLLFYAIHCPNNSPIATILTTSTQLVQLEDGAWSAGRVNGRLG